MWKERTMAEAVETTAVELAVFVICITDAPGYISCMHRIASWRQYSLGVTVAVILVTVATAVHR